MRDTSLIFLLLYHWQIVIEKQWRWRRVSSGVEVGSELDIVTTTTQQTVATSAPTQYQEEQSVPFRFTRHHTPFTHPAIL